jgi:hypothetical protein
MMSLKWFGRSLTATKWSFLSGLLRIRAATAAGPALAFACGENARLTLALRRASVVLAAVFTRASVFAVGSFSL